ncbi:MAG: tetratricopeptide repeat protein [Candidatus Melainabacteria bacterium]|nr:tetratricopeptide repeat protein [Candidatus Melainabacteria bacterium]
MSEEHKSEKAYQDWKMQMWLGQQAYEKGLYLVAQQKFQKALTDVEKFMDTDERQTMTLNNLALSFCAQGKHEEAEPLYQKALAIDQTSGAAGNLNLADDLSNIATHYAKQGLNAQAEPLYHRALKLLEQGLGENSAEVAGCLNNLGVLYCEERRCPEAINLYKRALKIEGSIYGSKSRQYAGTLVNLATAYCLSDRCEEADPLFEEGIRNLEYTMDPIHPELLDAMESYVVHLKKVGKTEQAIEINADIQRFKERGALKIF